MSTPPRRVAVVGGGITTLLADAGVHATVLEARSTVGGQLRSVELDGSILDVGAESLHTAAPGVGELLRRVGLEAEIVDARRGPTWLVTGGGLRRLPEGMRPAGPSRLWPVATSRILSPVGVLRAACEPFAPRSHPGHDVAVGTYLGGRFGSQLTDRLVDSLLGNLHAGDVYRPSLAAATPARDRAARRHRSLVLGRRKAPAGQSPRFVSVMGGLSRITEVLAADPRIAVHRSTPVNAVRPSGAGYQLLGPSGPVLDVDAVILAVPAATAARLVAPLDAEAGALLAEIRSASVATAIVSYWSAEVARHPPFRANGLLVPSSVGRLLKAATFPSNKWPALDHGGKFLRMSAGRVGEDRLSGRSDAELVCELHTDLMELTGATATPAASIVHRWPETMPQLVVGHLDVLATVRDRIGARHRIAVAGVAYDGVGVASCVRSAEASVERILEGHPSTDTPRRTPLDGHPSTDTPRRRRWHDRPRERLRYPHAAPRIRAIALAVGGAL